LHEFDTFLMFLSKRWRYGKPFKRATDRKSDTTNERHQYCIKRATSSWG